jgi:hypothetical protein
MVLLCVFVSPGHAAGAAAHPQRHATARTPEAGDTLACVHPCMAGATRDAVAVAAAVVVSQRTNQAALAARY